MLTDHPTGEDLDRFLRSSARSDSAARNAIIVRHLLAECPTCHHQLLAMGWSGLRLERLVQPSLVRSLADLESHQAVQPTYDYAQTFEKADQALSDFLAESPRPAESPDQLAAELNRLMAEDQVHLIEEGTRFARPELVRQLIERSHAARYDDPEEMLRWAVLARSLSERCVAASFGSAAQLADLRAQAWGQFGNAMRVMGQLPEAEEAMSTAQAYLEAGTGNPPVRAHLLEQIASLNTFQRRFDTAINTLDEAVEIYQELGEQHSLARTLVQRAIASLYAGEAESAVRILNRAIPLINHQEDPHLLLAACHNLVLCYIDLDRPEQALSLSSEAHDLYKEVKDTLILLRAAWQQGKLLHEVGHLRAAEMALLRARSGFMERGLSYEVAVVSLDLAAVYVKLGLVQELKQTVAETLPIFRALRVDRETLASLLQLQQVADQEQHALELIRVLTVQLDDVSGRPVLK